MGDGKPPSECPNGSNNEKKIFVSIRKFNFDVLNEMVREAEKEATTLEAVV